MKVSLAGNIKTMANFDVRAPIIVGLSLHWSWIWIVFWSSIFYTVWPGGFDFMRTSLPIETLWVLSLFTNFLGAALLAFSSVRLVTVGAHAMMPVAAAVLASLGTFIVAQPAQLFSEDFIVAGYAIGALITGLGSAIQFALWGELLTILGARQTVIYNVASILLGGLIYFVILVLDPVAARNIVALFPIVGMLMFKRCRSISLTYHEKSVKRFASSAATDKPKPEISGAEPDEKPSHKRRKHRDVASLIMLSLFFGMSYGLMKGLLVHGDVTFIAFRDGLNILSFALGALAALVTMSAFKMDFGSLTYQVALPLMAAGFLFMSLGDYFRLGGFALHQIGYQYFYVIIWALWPVLAKKNPKMPIAFFACISVASMQSGQFFGSLFGVSIYQVASGNSFLTYQISMVALFVILLVSLFGFGNSRTNWGLVRPMGQNTNVTKFRSTCERIASTRGLSARETEVFLLLAKGRNADYICTKLVISKPTVKTHIKNIYRKLEIHSQQALLDMVELESNTESKI